MKADFPEIIEKVQFSGISDILLEYNNKSFQESECFYADPTVFDVFSWPVISGNPKTALEAPYSIILTESTAKKYFGNEDPLGKVLDGIGGRAADGAYTVTAVVEDIPQNSHFKFDILMSMSSFKQTRPEIFDWWGYVDFYTYLLVSDNFNQDAFQAKVPAFLDKHIGSEQLEEFPYYFSLEAMNAIYLHSSFKHLYLFSNWLVYFGDCQYQFYESCDRTFYGARQRSWGIRLSEQNEKDLSTNF